MKTLETIFGPNSALVEELYNQYKESPSSVPNYWRQYFDELDGKPVSGPEREPTSLTGPESVSGVAPEPAPRTGPEPTERPKPRPVKEEKQKAAPKPSGDVELIQIKGVSGKIVENMETSLEVPTATSLRVLPVKMLMEDRKIINSHLERRIQPKTTLTHFIAWAVIRALKEFPKLNSYYTKQDGKHYRAQPTNINLGIAVDLPTKDGSRNLVVPNIKAVDQMDFREFLVAFHELIERARAGKLEVTDYQDTTITITNPGTIGTVSSMPRLMKKQGSIIATGSMDYPAEFQSMSQEVLNQLGISRVMTMTCTYDHRHIQGAESGSFLARVHKLLSGEADFFDEIFKDLDIPYEPVPFGTDNYTGFLNGSASIESNKKAISVMRLIHMYRTFGHVLADVNPLKHGPGYNAELDFEYYGLTMWDLDREFYCGGLGGHEKAPLRVIVKLLRDTYCGYIGAEFTHIHNLEERHWLREKMESSLNNPHLGKDEKRRILRKLNQASAFEEFLHKKYIGHKRFSLEGADTLIPMLDFMLEKAGEYDVKEVLFGMAHRGRLNVLVNTMGKSYRKVFAEFEGNIDPDTFHGSGDVKYHLGAGGEHVTNDGKNIRLQLLPNPSHLESVNPVVEGAVRAKQDVLELPQPDKKIIPLLIHGDAAFAGQGVVTETLNMSQLDGFKTGGTIHVIINNQIGFTTLPKDARSTDYASDVAKTILAPIFHVNGDEPEAAVHVMKLAIDYREKFDKDVVIDLVCYRKHGHNEGDEPAFTQPDLYKEIKDHPTVRQSYTDELVHKNELTKDEVDQIFQEFDELLEEAFKEAKKAPDLKVTDKHIVRTDLRQKERVPIPDTTYDAEKLKEIALQLNKVPKGFDANPKLLRILAKRHEIVANNEKKIDWGFAEALAFGSLLKEGTRIRLTGQDSERGTFSHRHAVLHGTKKSQNFIPLNNLSDGQAKFSIYNSLLSEFAALGFEFGYSSTNLEDLVIWEAQFGDFNNGAQIIIDQYISSSEVKWRQNSGLVMLLPHGYEGQGPEHSSARLERFLQLCAEDNIQVVNCTTPAQYYHMFRRQAMQKTKKPLIVMTPKSLLRHSRAVSNTEELATGRFQELIPDQDVKKSRDVDRIIFCSGKVYYDLLAYKENNGIDHVAITRLEQFYPFPDKDLEKYLKEYKHVKKLVWCQEEPKNMGGWYFVQTRFKHMLQKGQVLHYEGRTASASPATGSSRLHAAEQEKLVTNAFEKK
ncbi:MAG: multifunctional oxoglutarate decarboxylase/oxoglutarate dehydrogenase thiamine pyrophosphate-binding subunit/dihydrolipoyllysine-residue succinyltransferase subunit [Balneolales bacterium]